MEKMSLLIIDDEQAQLESLKSFLKRRKFNVFTAQSGEEGFYIVKENTIDVVLTDYRMPGWSGLDTLKNIKNLNPEIDVVVITAFGSVEDAVELMKQGAYDYLTKPIDLDELESLLERLTEKRLLTAENKQLKEQLNERFRFDSIISQSGKMEEVVNLAGRVAQSKATVLVRGESGTGKELFSKAIHFASPRKDKPLITVNVAALSENLLESELFGHVKGSFTGAVKDRIGRFEEADGGTLFIDEVGDIPASVQVKLLRALQFGEIQPIGSNETKKVDVRIIAATNKDLETAMRDNEFREDLYYRLNVVTLNIPALRERKTDIPVLIDHFTKKYDQENQKDVKGFTKEALDALMKYDFPGNVRELENIIEHAIVLSRNEYIDVKDLPGTMRNLFESSDYDPHNFNKSYDEKIKEYEIAMITEALSRSEGNQSAAARLLQMSERHLRSRLQRLGLK